MKTTKFFIMALAALSLAACNKETGEGNPAKTTKSIFVKIGAGTLVANDIPNVGEVATKVNDLNLFFLNGANAVVDHKEIGSGAIDALMKDGVKYEGINGSATRLYIVANNVKNQTSDDLQNLTSLAEIQAKVRTTLSQNPAATETVGSWEYVTMAGTGIIQTSGSTSSVAVALTPLMSRIEIHKISTDATITSFKLAGIYINNHYVNLKLDGTADGTVVFYNDAADYTTENYGHYADIAADMAKETAGKCYGYQVVAGSVMPHIVLALTEVVIGTTTLTDTQYVTVRSYKKEGAPVNAMLANNIYKISDIQFASRHVGPAPETEDKIIDVTVTVNNWTRNDITPDL